MCNTPLLDIKAVDRRLSKSVGKNSMVLDVGCGGGVDVLLMAKNGAFAIGLDIMLASVQISGAREKAKSNKLIGRVGFIIASAMNIPFKNDIFDFTTSFSVIDHLPNKDEAFNAVKEMARVTKYEGDIIVTIPNSLFFIGTISRWILRISKTETFFEQRFSPNELKKMFIKSGLKIQQYDSEWPTNIDKIMIDRRVPPFLRGKIPIKTMFPFLKIFKAFNNLSIFKLCGARFGFRAKKINLSLVYTRAPSS
ncbi:MAG: class I SAM-dependent methyltransferase [Candidatus Hodarchaeota archaeon]